LTFLFCPALPYFLNQQNDVSLTSKSNNSATVQPNPMKIEPDTDLDLLYISSFQFKLIKSTVQPEIAPKVTAGARAPSFVDLVV
jgi:hypothetical protein